MQQTTHSSTTDRNRGSYTCPLCDHTGETPTDVYAHLQVSHRKSEISEALIEATTDEDTRPERIEQ